jgi:hypothetical protein
VCSTPTNIDSIFYVKNFVRGEGTLDVPCDGGNYTAEVYGALALAGGVREVNEVHKSVPFTMSTSCATTPASVWAGGPAAVYPDFVLPTAIYAGQFPPPYDKYSVAVTGLGYPWAVSDWTLTYGGQLTPTTYRSATATFDSPPLAPRPTAFEFVGVFKLHSSTSLAGDVAVPWVKTVRKIGPVPFQASGLPIP